MSNQAKFRWPTIVTAGTCLALSGISAWWVFAAYHDFRSSDFTLVSGAPIMETCVESPSEGQLKEAKYDKTPWSCSATSKDELANLMAVTVHAMRAAYDAAGGASGSWTSDAKAIYHAAALAAQGSANAYQVTGELAFTTLSLLGSPETNCDTIYSKSVTDEGATPTPSLVNVACDDEKNDPNIVPDATAIAAIDLDLQYTHCRHQFGYGRSASAKGTLGIPKVGEEAKPVLFPVIGTNSTTAWYDKSRILVGTRWGYASVFYVIAMLTLSFFVMDNTILLLAELTRVDAYFAQNAITEGSGRSMREGCVCRPHAPARAEHG
jgi:hypothetical protein